MLNTEIIFIHRHIHYLTSLWIHSHGRTGNGPTRGPARSGAVRPSPPPVFSLNTQVWKQSWCRIQGRQTIIDDSLYDHCAAPEENIVKSLLFIGYSLYDHCAAPEKIIATSLLFIGYALYDHCATPAEIIATSLLLIAYSLYNQCAFIATTIIPMKHIRFLFRNRGPGIRFEEAVTTTVYKNIFAKWKRNGVLQNGNGIPFCKLETEFSFFNWRCTASVHSAAVSRHVFDFSTCVSDVHSDDYIYCTDV